MTLRVTKNSEHFQFKTAHELREFLNGFKRTDLEAVYFINGEQDNLTIVWETEILSDSSTVKNIVII